MVDDFYSKKQANIEGLLFEVMCEPDTSGGIDEWVAAVRRQHQTFRAIVEYINRFTFIAAIDDGSNNER